MSEIAQALKRLRARVVGFQASNNVYRVIDEEIKKYDPTWIGDQRRARKKQIADRNDLVQDLQAKCERLEKALICVSNDLDAIKPEFKEELSELISEVQQALAEGEG